MLSKLACCPLMAEASIETLIKVILPSADILTPNIPEAEKIARMEIVSVGDMERAAQKIYGTGCTFSSAIAAQLAKGKNIQDAVRLAKVYVTMAIEHSLDIGKGNGPTHHFYQVYRSGLQMENEKGENKNEI